MIRDVLNVIWIKWNVNETANNVILFELSHTFGVKQKKTSDNIENNRMTRFV